MAYNTQYYVHTDLATVAGFFVMERAVSTRYQQLMDGQELSLWWDESAKFLQKRLQRELLQNSEKEKNDVQTLVKVKNECILLRYILQSYDYKTVTLDLFIQQMRAEFEARLIATSLGKIVKEMRNDLLQPFVIRNPQDFESYVLDFQLDGPVNEEDVVVENKAQEERKYDREIGKNSNLQTQSQFLPDIKEDDVV
ncbi:hypothetical protein RFI_36135, partial [Reticulomyxa filosa]